MKQVQAEEIYILYDRFINEFLFQCLYLRFCGINPTKMDYIQ